MRIASRRNRCRTAMMALIFLLVPIAAIAGNIHGRIEIHPPDGTRVSGDWIRVLLVTAPIAVPEPGDLSGLVPLARMDRVISAHTDFYKRYQQELDREGYLAASVLTTDTGEFKFVDVAPGRYVVLVTFPSMIGGYKVAWQVPVSMPADGDARVDLNWDNMALPTQKR